MLLTIITHKRPGESRTTKHAKKEKKGRRLSPNADLASAEAQEDRPLRNANPDGTAAKSPRNVPCAKSETALFPASASSASLGFRRYPAERGGEEALPCVSATAMTFPYSTSVTKTSEGTSGGTKTKRRRHSDGLEVDSEPEPPCLSRLEAGGHLRYVAESNEYSPGETHQEGAVPYLARHAKLSEEVKK